MKRGLRISQILANFAPESGLSTREPPRKQKLSVKTDAENPESGLAAEPAGADGAGGVRGAKWYVAIVNARHEKAVGDKLREINVINYVATQKEVRLWRNGRRKTVDRVVIPSVVFINCTEEERRHIVTLPYINRFMVNRSAAPIGLRRPVAVIADAEMQKLRFMLGQTDTPVDFVPTAFHVNDTVRVIRGNLRGLQGEICKNADGTHTLLVSLDLLGGATLRISPLDVEKLLL